MEWILEIILEIIGETINSEEVNKIARMVLLSILAWFVIIVGILVGISALSTTGIIGSVISWLISAGFVIIWIYGLININKKNKQG